MLDVIFDMVNWLIIVNLSSVYFTQNYRMVHEKQEQKQRIYMYSIIKEVKQKDIGVTNNWLISVINTQFIHNFLMSHSYLKS